MNKEYAEEVAARIIEQLKQGTAPWQKPWKPGELRLPYNPTSGKEYRGMNTLWLHMQGYGDPRWMTYKQADAAGAQVRKGSRGTRIVYWKFHDDRPLKDVHGRPVLDSEGKPKTVRVELEKPRVFTAVVFNGEQIDGLPALEARTPGHEPERHARAEAILANSTAKISHVEGDRAYYQPATDSITLPARHQFSTADGYYATALHELGHWTGHPSRLDRDLSHPFGSEGYAREELRAEIASLMLGERLGIGHDPGQHVAYVGSWIKKLEEDPREIFRAASDAERINSFVMGFELEQVAERLRSPELLDDAGRMALARENERPAPVLHQAPEASTMTPQRTYLAVPYSEKEQAKKAGARWDKEAKSWYAPAGADIEASLKRWLPSERASTEVESDPPEAAFAQALKDMGLIVKGTPEMDGKLHRVPVEGDKGGERSGAYIGHLDGRIPAGFIQNYKGGTLNWKYEGKVQSLSAEERARLDREAADRAQRRDAEIALGHENAAQVAAALWAEAPPATADNPYCARKGIANPGEKGLRVVPETVSPAAEAAGVRIAKTVRQAKAMREALADSEPNARVFLAGDLLVPGIDADARLWTLQTINPQFKGFIKGGRKIGLFSVAGGSPEAAADYLAGDSASPIVVSEGYATGDTVAALLERPVFVAFDSGNLAPVMRELAARYPDRAKLIAADNDHRAEKEIGADGKPRINVGLAKANDAGTSYGAGVVAPPFADDEKGSDWNDFAEIHGADAARDTLVSEIAKARVEAAIASERLMMLAREREMEARNDPTTSLDDDHVAAERNAAHELMAQAIAGDQAARAQALDALTSGTSAPAAARSIELTAHELENEVREQREIAAHNPTSSDRDNDMPPAKSRPRAAADHGIEL